MRVLMYTPTLDLDDRIFGFTRGWVHAIQQQTQHPLILVTRALRTEHVPERVLGIALGMSWAKRVWRLWQVSIQHRKDYDAVFVHMTPQVVLAGWMLWRLLGKKLFFWYAHGSTPWYVRVALWMSDGAFSPNPSSLRLSSPKIHYVGHGIDTELFSPDASIPRESVFRTIGRITPKKRLESTLEILGELYRQDPELVWRYEIIGPSLGEMAYVERLQAIARQLGIDDRVTFRSEGIPYKDLPNLYRSCAAFLSTSDTGSMDKAVLEALACGTPVFATGEAYQGMEGVYALQASPGALEGLERVIYTLSSDAAGCEGVSHQHDLQGLVRRVLFGMTSTV